MAGNLRMIQCCHIWGNFPILGKFWVQAGKFFSLWGTSAFGEISGWAIFLIFYVVSKKI
jgi:hypothetical protein